MSPSATSAATPPGGGGGAAAAGAGVGGAVEGGGRSRGAFAAGWYGCHTPRVYRRAEWVSVEVRAASANELQLWRRATGGSGDAGLLAGDREVTKLVLSKLLDPIYESGAVVDGYPRTKTQVECLKMFHGRLSELRSKYLGTFQESQFPKPRFHIIMLFIDEEESVRRQLLRGQRALAHNAEVEASGVGEKMEVRKTDFEEEAAHRRYKTFKESTYDSLTTLREVFHYHFINAHGTIIEVQQRIIQELKYQSSLELDQPTYDRISSIPLAEKLSLHARQLLVHRLDSYEKFHSELFDQVVSLIKTKFIPVVEKHSISGLAYINSEDVVFNDPLAIAMLIDVFTERGFTAVVDIRRMEVPSRIDPKSYEIINRVKKVYRVRINFDGSKIRRGL